MNRKITTQKLFYSLVGIWLLFIPAFLSGQGILYEENFGNPTSNTLIQNYTGWQNSSVTYSGNGTCDVRTSNASSGYGGASGGGNVMINDTLKWFQISGINTSVSSSGTVKMFCGLRKTTSENGTNFKVSYSLDSVVWVDLLLQDTLPTGSGTSGWHRVCYQNIPICSNLHIRFSSNVNVDFRLDDISIVDGDVEEMETVSAPVFSPAAGTFYEAKLVSISSSTPDAVIHYTTDGTVPDESSEVYNSPILVDETAEIKAFATKTGMYSSEVKTANYVILDTNALVELPFDISDNSTTTKADITLMSGFKGNKLGKTYSDGGAKFEAKYAGYATLTAHLDSAPDTLSFSVKGVKSNSLYQNIQFDVLESADGVNWNAVVSLDEVSIGTSSYTNIEGVKLNNNTRYVRWSLSNATYGNTQLNNIKITKRNQGSGEGEVGIDDYDICSHSEVYPNPAHHYFRWNFCSMAEVIQLFNMQGELVRSWQNVESDQYLDITNVPKGKYVLKALTSSGEYVKKLIVW